MNIHEYQAKQILKAFGIDLPAGMPVFNLDEVRKYAEELFKKSKVVVVKAQIHAGGRGKAGGVKLTRSVDEAYQVAKEMLGMKLVTHQTGPEGRIVKRLYLEEGSSIKKEYYLSIVLDRQSGRMAFIASAEGGMDIEEVAASHPEKIIKAIVDPSYGVQGFHIRKLGFGIGLNTAQLKPFGEIVKVLYKIALEKDAVQIEINPLVETEDGRFIPLDAKFNFDDNGLFRHPDIEKLRDFDEEEPLEIEASKYGLSYVKMDGDIGCMVNGAGLAMATMDIIKLYGSEPANFLDVGGTATIERVAHAFRIVLSDKRVKGVLINIFGGIVRCDVIANGVVETVKNLGLSIPVVVRLEGTNSDLGKEILTNSGLKILPADNLEDAAKKIVNAIK